MNKNVVTEYNAKDWKISELYPETSGKYVFDWMVYDPLGGVRCQNCGKPIKWLVYIHDENDESRKFVVGDNCIGFLLSMQGGLENIGELENFLDAKKRLVATLQWLTKNSADKLGLEDVLCHIYPGSLETPGAGITFELLDDNMGVTISFRGVSKVLDLPGLTPNDFVRFFPRIKERLVEYRYEDKQRNMMSFIFNLMVNKKTESAESELYKSKKLVSYDIPILDDPKITATLIKRNNLYRRDVGRYLVNAGGEPLELTGQRESIVYWSTKPKNVFPECKFTERSFPTMEELFNKLCKNNLSVSEQLEASYQRELDEATRREEFERKQEEKSRIRQANIDTRRSTIVSEITENPGLVIDGLKGKAVELKWIEKYEPQLKDLVKTKIKGCNPDSRTFEFAINNCRWEKTITYRPQLEKLKTMDAVTKLGYAKNIFKFTLNRLHLVDSWTVKENNLVIDYKFVPETIKELPNEVQVSGKTTIKISVDETKFESRKRSMKPVR